jgi:hypothetical protein
MVGLIKFLKTIALIYALTIAMMFMLVIGTNLALAS